MVRYAENTGVSSEKSRAEIEHILQRYGADQFMYGWQEDKAVVCFRANRLHVRFDLPMPDQYAPEFAFTPGRGLERTDAQRLAAWEQACRQRWRALALVIKAKLEAAETGITTFEEEFLAHIVLPDGQTVGKFVLPQVAIAYETGNMPPLLPYYKEAQ